VTDRLTACNGRFLVLASLNLLPLVAHAQAPGPNLAVIRRNASISEIDRQNIQRWLDGQMNQLFASNALDVDGAAFRNALLEHYQAGDATPAFRQVLSTSVIEALSRRYQGKTSLDDPNLPRPLPVVYSLAIINLFNDPGSIPLFRQAMMDSSNSPAPGIRAVALDGLIRMRDRMNAQTWSAVVADAQKLAAEETNPVVLVRLYRLLAPDNPEARAAEGTVAIVRILENRLNRFEKQGQVPSIAEREAAARLGARAVGMQNTQQLNNVVLQLGRLLADAVFAFNSSSTPAAHKEDLERVIIATEQALVAIANAKASGQPRPEVTRALLTPGPDQAQRIAAEVNKWIGTAESPGFLNAPPFSLPAGLNIQRVVSTATATASP
jgi:hypothetical protein